MEENHLDKRFAIYKWKSANEAELQNFPEMDEEQLRNLTCETYQLKLSSSYVQEHVDGDILIHVHNGKDGLLRTRIQSRHGLGITHQK